MYFFKYIDLWCAKVNFYVVVHYDNRSWGSFEKCTLIVVVLKVFFFNCIRIFKLYRT